MLTLVSQSQSRFSTPQEARLGNRGSVPVRDSGTQNPCRIMVDGPTQKETDVRTRKIADVVRKALN